jgi:hypothetical protein
MSNTTRRRHVSTLTLVAALAAALGPARGDDRVPPDLYGSCDGRQAGAACSATSPAGTFQGTCASAPDGRLACRPSEPPPPQEAVAACAAKRAGDGCSVAFGPLTMTGACAAVQDGRLACRPSGPPRQP